MGINERTSHLNQINHTSKGGLPNPLEAFAPYLITGIAAVLLLSTLHKFAQTGDGHELVITSVNGGVLHPPGFPVQAWLNKLFINIPVLTIDFRLSLLSFLAHLGTIFFISDSLKRLGSTWIFQLLGALGFGLFLPMWTLGVQPEVFALAHLFIAAFLWFGIKTVNAPAGRRPAVGDSVIFGVLFGFAMSQHLISATLIGPSLVILTFLYKRTGIKPNCQLSQSR